MLKSVLKCVLYECDYIDNWQVLGKNVNVLLQW